MPSLMVAASGRAGISNIPKASFRVDAVLVTSGRTLSLLLAAGS
jgi:hypothetical protein